MKNKLIVIIVVVTIGLFQTSCNEVKKCFGISVETNSKVMKPVSKSIGKEDKQEAKVVCSDGCESNSKSQTFACKLTSLELQKRKATILASLGKQILEKRELKNGMAFKFAGTDKAMDELFEFIKTERQCCDFFNFNLNINGDESAIWLELTGKKGVKEFIEGELGF